MKKLTEKDISREIEKIAKNSAEAFSHKELAVLYAHQVLSGRLGVENEEAQRRQIRCGLWTSCLTARLKGAASRT